MKLAVSKKATVSSMHLRGIVNGFLACALSQHGHSVCASWAHELYVFIKKLRITSDLKGPPTAGHTAASQPARREHRTSY